jgi:hypothetical protein
MAIAVTFAEQGEWDTAQSYLPKPGGRLREGVPAKRKQPEARLRKQLHRL